MWDKISHVLWVPKLHPFPAHEFEVVLGHRFPRAMREPAPRSVQVVSIDNDEEVVSHMKAVRSRKGEVLVDENNPRYC